ncbi:hypothetical protein KF840_21225 [bacterium]|nr:hypothetical protein [bacterium]
MTQPVDSSILHEIVRIIESRRKVPDKVIVTSKEYLLTYLEDHRNRLEEALMRFDRDRLNMLYGQLASKVKYQLLRRVPARAAAAMGLQKPTAPGKSRAAAPAAGKKPAAKAPAAKATKAAVKGKAKPAAARKSAAAKKAPSTKKPTAAKKAKAAPRRAAARPKKKSRR